MQIIGVVSEFDPFHNGHQHLLQTIHALHPHASVISVMSPNVTQRGTFSFSEKYSRAASAVLGGADLVVEHPSVFVLASAERFASSALMLMQLTGCVTDLYFGAETDDLILLEELAHSLLSEEFETYIRNTKQTNSSYIEIQQRFLEEKYGDKASAALLPNNILALEYLKAIEREKLEITPHLIVRKAAMHNSFEVNGTICSGSFIRQSASEGGLESIRSYVPASTYDLLCACEKEETIFRSPYHFQKDCIAYLRRQSSGYFAAISDCETGLENRICEILGKDCDLEAMIEMIHGKRYTKSRIRRIIMNAYLGIDREIQSLSHAYIRPLALNKKGKELLRLMKTTSAVPVLSKTTEYKSLQEDAQRILLKEVFVTDMFRSACSEKNRETGYDLKCNPMFIAVDQST